MDPKPDDLISITRGEADAVRVQAAAVAAQQMALTLEEERLRQRGAALERQEAQLAAHLQERRERLVELQEQVRQDREALKLERAAVETERDELRRGLASERALATAAAESAKKERTRLVELRRRLHKRWRRHWLARQAEQDRREKELSIERGNLADDAKTLKRERELFLQSQGRLNSEAEWSRRKLQADWQELALAQQEWEACLNHEKTERQRQHAELTARERVVAAATDQLAGDERLWMSKKRDLVRECQGLETRVANLRARLATAKAAESSPWHTAPVPLGVTISADAEVTLPEALQTLADDLCDQRRHLLEQWQRLLAVLARWDGERLALLADLDAAASRLAQRETTLSKRETEMAMELTASRHLRENAERECTALQARQSLIAVREASLESERSMLLSDVRSRQESIAMENARLHDLRRRWGERRRQELDELGTVRSRCENSRAKYLELWQECQARRNALTESQRELDARTTAIARLRQEILGRAPDAAAAERRLAKLEARERARILAAERELAKLQKSAKDESARLAAEWQRLASEEAKLLQRQAALNQLRDGLESAAMEAETRAKSRRDELWRLQACHERDARELATLRDELERIARYLIGEDASAPTERQAA